MRRQLWLRAALTVLSTHQMKGYRFNHFKKEERHQSSGSGAEFLHWIFEGLPRQPRAPWHRRLSEPSFTGSPLPPTPRKGAAAGCPLEMIEKSSLSSAAAVHPFHQRRPLHYINCRSSFHPIEFLPPSSPSSPSPPHSPLLLPPLIFDC